VLSVVEDEDGYAATFRIAMLPGRSRHAAPGRGPDGPILRQSFE
jgi:hypothetical protein